MSNITSEIKGLNPELDTKIVSTSVQTDLFSENVVLKVCYSLGACFQKIECKDNLWVIYLMVPKSFTKDQINKLEADINQELIDFTLRERVFSETETIRNLILANAFANTSLSE